MSMEQFLDDLRRQGATVQAVDGRVRVEGPARVVTQALRETVAQKKEEILAVLLDTPDAAHHTPDPTPPELWPGGLGINEEAAVVFSRFADHGTQPAWDDLTGAACLERTREWCEKTLEAVYRGELTLFLTADGRVSPAPRGAIS